MVKKYRVKYSDKNAVRLIKTYIKRILKGKNMQDKQVIVLCIGSDKSTGDCLGPYIGTLLKNLGYKNIIGDLNNTVNATNITEVKETIYKLYKNPYIIAIDASLGKAESVGYIYVEGKPLKPGAGVNKELPEIGDLGIAGIVNTGGYMEYYVLQNTSFARVYAMANVIVEGLDSILSSKRFENCIKNNTDSLFELIATTKMEENPFYGKIN